MVQKAPGWLLDGLAVAGGMMPAIGFAADEGDDEKPTWPILSLASSRSRSSLPILAVALGAPAIALIDFFNTQRGAAEATARPAPQEDAEDGI